MLTTAGVVHARKFLDNGARHFFSRKVCSKNRFHAKGIARAQILDEDF